MLTLVVFILILSVLVLIHEFGHFFAAKKAGIKVEEFGFGLPPKVFGIKKGETEYTLNLLPFGGFVRLLGEDMEEEGAEMDPRSFSSKKPLTRAIILVAGVFMNVILALALYYVFFAANSYKSLTLPLLNNFNFPYGDERVISTVVTGYLQESPADKAQIVPGEAIIEVDGAPVYNVEDIRDELSGKAGSQVTLQLMDVRSFDRTLRTVEVTPEENEDGAVRIGVVLTPAVTLDYSDNKLLSAPMHAYNVLSYSKSAFGSLLSTSVEERTIEPVSATVAGPVGIFSVVGGIIDYGGKEAVLGLVDLVALLSLSLAILNIMPFPALDGGRLLFVLLEKVRGGRKLSPSVEATIHKWGMVLLLGLLVLVTFKDVTTLFVQ